MTTKFMEQVEVARVAFSARWQPSSLAVVDSGLFERFEQQLALWNEAVAVGHADEIEIQAGGMVRAYEAASKRLEAHRMTAFIVGHDHERGVSVCVSAHSESLEFAKRSTDLPMEWVTPDAMARLVSQARALGATIDDKEDRAS